jgi:hypothetical protein
MTAPKILVYSVARGAGIPQSVQRLATGWTVRGSNPGRGGGARFTAPVQSVRGAHTVSYTIGTGSLSRGVKRRGRGVEQPPHLVKQKQKQSCYRTGGAQGVPES